MKKEVVSFIVPALNEEHNIRDTFNTIRVNVPYGKVDYEIMFVDGGSTDRTVQIARFLAKSDSRIRVSADGDISGFGDAFKKGVSNAVGDYIMLVPGDNEVSGEAIAAILSKVGEADMIIPYFTNQEIRPLGRKILSRAFVGMLNVITGMNLHYYNGTVLYRARLLKGYNIRTAGFAFQAECVISFISSGCTYTEVGTRIQVRGCGKTKAFEFRNLVSVGAFVLGLVVRHRVLGVRQTPAQQFQRERRKGGSVVAMDLPPLTIPPEINYIAAFLTFRCNLKCPYCINNYEAEILEKRSLGGKAWVSALNRLLLTHNLPITLQGGEPTLHKDFYYIVDNLRSDIEIDILTNLQFDVDEFISRVNPKRINRDDRYQSIRASYHPGQMDVDDTMARAAKLQNAGFSICVSAVAHPEAAAAIDEARAKAEASGVTFFEKEFLGFYAGKSYGTYRYPGALLCQSKQRVMCRSTEVLISPSLAIHRCTRDVYTNSHALGHLLDPEFTIQYKYRTCSNYGYCNPCDVKVKTDRFLTPGHTSVDIKPAA